jgi:lysophospholipase L1-like esterase
MKVGDSITDSLDFMACFETESPNLNSYGYPELVAAHNNFLNGSISGTTPYARQSLAAMGSQTAEWVVSGNPSPLAQEIAASNAGYAVVMFGTNDLWYGGSGDNPDLKYAWYATNMWSLLDTLIAEGVVPIISSIPPHNGDPSFFHDLVPGLNDVARGLAEAYQIPFVNLYSALLPLPDQGLGGDGIHLNRMEYNAICNFSSDGLDYGYNTRNLLTLEALDRAWQVTKVNGETALDDMGISMLSGDGSGEAPFVVDQIPFTAIVKSSLTKSTLEPIQSGCTSSTTGAVYNFSLTKSTSLRILALDRNNVGVSIALLNRSSSNPCLAQRERMIEGAFEPGSYDLVIEGLSSNIDETLLVISVL